MRRAAGSGALIGIMLAAGCAGGHTGNGHIAPGRRGVPSRPTPASHAQNGSLVRVPRPDYADPASVAASFYVAWASIDAVHDNPDTFVARCAPLVTTSLERQLSASQPAAAAWQAMRDERMVSLVRVQAVTRPDGAPDSTSSVVYLRVYATRVTTSSSGRETTSDGVTVQLTRTSGRWLVSAALFY